MRLFQLALLAKEIEELSDEGLQQISCYGKPEVSMEPRAFMEMFPTCWTDEEPFQSSTGRFIFVRRIRIDGVTYSCIMEVKNELGSA